MGFLPRLAERRSSELLLQEPPAPAYARATLCSAQKHLVLYGQCFDLLYETFYPCAQTRLLVRPFLSSLTEAMPRT